MPVEHEIAFEDEVCAHLPANGWAYSPDDTVDDPPVADGAPVPLFAARLEMRAQSGRSETAVRYQGKPVHQQTMVWSPPSAG